MQSCRADQQRGESEINWPQCNYHSLCQVWGDNSILRFLLATFTVGGREGRREEKGETTETLFLFYFSKYLHLHNIPCLSLCLPASTKKKIQFLSFMALNFF